MERDSAGAIFNLQNRSRSTTCGRPHGSYQNCCITPVIDRNAGRRLCGGAFVPRRLQFSICILQLSVLAENLSVSPDRQGQVIRPPAFSSLLRGGSHRQSRQSQVAKGGLERSEEYILHFLPTSLFKKAERVEPHIARSVLPCLTPVHCQRDLPLR